MYLPLFALLYLLSLLPLRALYTISDCLRPILRHVLRYRLRIVRHNIETAFPELDAEGRSHIERRYYQWFCDYAVETIKLLTMSRREMSRRMTFSSTEEINRVLASGQSVALYMGHYCNWEWVTSMPLITSLDVQFGQIYHPLENTHFDAFFRHLRGRFGAVSIPMQQTIRQIVRHERGGRRVMIGYISDQVPNWNSIHYFTQFLNHDTPVFDGTERIAARLGHAVYYLDIQRIRRGYYHGRFRLITTDPAAEPEHQITERYYRCLEENIRRQPALWLWSHNRWKRTREQWEHWKLYPAEF